ncbi:MAG TPA: MarR family transcriptional regulator [Clostridiales bacterium]|nr:MarR family transcriptional regulator [Clostridiales bacterium]
MVEELKNLDLVDLLGERHLMIRKRLAEMWDTQGESHVTISNSEWFIMAKIFTQENPTIAQVAKQTDISRQAVHKAVKSLEAKELVKTTNSTNRVKGLELTQTGKESYDKILSLKSELEEHIKQIVGVKNVELLKKILGTDWGI